MQSFQLADYRILLQSKDGAFQFKEGNLYQEWVNLSFEEAKDVLLNGGMPVEVQ